MTTETVIWMVDGQSESGLDSIRNSCDVLNWLWRFEARGYDSEFTEYFLYSQRKNLLLELLPQTPKSPQMIL